MLDQKPKRYKRIEKEIEEYSGSDKRGFACVQRGHAMQSGKPKRRNL